MGLNPSWGTFFLILLFLLHYFFNLFVSIIIIIINFIIIILSLNYKKTTQLQLYSTMHTYDLKVVGSNPSCGTAFF